MSPHRPRTYRLILYDLLVGGPTRPRSTLIKRAFGDYQPQHPENALWMVARGITHAQPQVVTP